MKIKQCSHGMNVVIAETESQDLINLDGQSCLEITYELAERANRIFFLGNLPASIKISQPDKNGNRVFKKYEFADMGKEAE